jgi:predicted nucleic acid-binding Zn ribbon protein
MLSPIYFCQFCGDEFDPIEGTDPNFCSNDCEEDASREDEEWEEEKAIYNEGFGRKVL